MKKRTKAARSEGNTAVCSERGRGLGEDEGSFSQMAEWQVLANDHGAADLPRDYAHMQISAFAI